MKEQFVTYEIALKLKELGFDEECFAIYDAYQNNKLVYLNEGNKNSNGIIKTNKSMDISCLAPLWQQAISFLKSKGVLIAELWDGWEYGKDGEDFNYAKTLDEAVQKAIELIEQTK